MLLVIDVGNTEVTLGLFEGEDLRRSFRVSSETRRTADEVELMLRQVFPELEHARAKPGRSAAAGRSGGRAGGKGTAYGAAIGSVVPVQTPLFVEAARRLMGTIILPPSRSASSHVGAKCETPAFT